VKPYYQDSAVTIYHGDWNDCLHILIDNKIDAIVTDPPYGINWRPRVNHQDQQWKDLKKFDPRPFLRFGSEHLFWGGNYFCSLLPDSPDWLIWIKRPIDMDFSTDKRSYSTVELAWTDFGCRTRFKSHVWDGGLRAGSEENRSFCHPAQKPYEIMAWCMSFSKTHGTIFDPFMGSGTTLRAAKDLGRKAIGIEIEERYCEIAAKRMAQEVLFPPAIQANQTPSALPFPESSPEGA
jgi:DNA modification methylase